MLIAGREPIKYNFMSETVSRIAKHKEYIKLNMYLQGEPTAVHNAVVVRFDRRRIGHGMLGNDNMSLSNLRKQE